MIPLGTKAPSFSLNDVITGNLITFNNQSTYQVTVICFLCNHCPYVHHINPALAQLAHDYLLQGVYFAAINSNDTIKYPQDAPELMKLTAAKEHYPFPYLFDETQETAKAYHAACTPDFFVFNQEQYLIYRGQFDDSRPGNNLPVTGASLRQVLDYALHDKPLDFEQKPSLGCNIKWKT
jgi:thiol-disulfide isomerase/thioredoxin